jgi:hypothetical protein
VIDLSLQAIVLKSEFKNPLFAAEITAQAATSTGFPLFARHAIPNRPRG